jgi:hypothetical protein
MQEPKPITEASELLHHIRGLSQEADWGEAELDAALREGGVDPECLISHVMTDIKRHLRPADAAAGHTEQAAPARPLLVALRSATHLPPSAIAEALEVPVPFLSMVSRHPKAVPARWQQELARRAEQRLQMDQQTVLHSFAADFQYDLAASREAPYPANAVQHYEDILERASMSPEMRQFWHNLAQDAR